MLLNTASIVVYVMLNKNRYISRGLFGDFWGNFGGILGEFWRQVQMEHLQGNCRYCGIPAAYNKQGQWGRACSGCKGSLTKMLRSGKYGPTYEKATKERLLDMVYDHLAGKWIDHSKGEEY